MKKIAVFGLVLLLLCFAVPMFAQSDQRVVIGIEAELGQKIFSVGSMAEKEVLAPVLGIGTESSSGPTFKDSMSAAASHNLFEKKGKSVRMLPPIRAAPAIDV